MQKSKTWHCCSLNCHSCSCFWNFSYVRMRTSKLKMAQLNHNNCNIKSALSQIIMHTSYTLKDSFLYHGRPIARHTKQRPKTTYAKSLVHTQHVDSTEQNGHIATFKIGQIKHTDANVQHVAWVKFRFGSSHPCLIFKILVDVIAIEPCHNDGIHVRNWLARWQIYGWENLGNVRV